MSEIQFLVTLLTQYELNDEVKKLCIERIGEVEKMGKVPFPTPQRQIPVSYNQDIPVQAASTLAAMARQQGEDMAVIAPQANLSASTASRVSNTDLTKEVVTSSSSYGSTRGPSKMRGRL